jgi:hypothetical protein
MIRCKTERVNEFGTLGVERSMEQRSVPDK